MSEDSIKSVHMHVAITEEMNNSVTTTLALVREKMSHEIGASFAKRVTRSDVIRMAIDSGLALLDKSIEEWRKSK